MLLPAQGSALRRGLDEWLDRLDLAPEIVGEIGASGLMKTFGQAGVGVFVAPTAVAGEVAVVDGARVHSGFQHALSMAAYRFG